MNQSAHETDVGQDGVALFYALLVSLVVGGIVVVVFAGALSQQRQSAFELDFEDSIHVAEAGAEIYLGRLKADNSLNSGVSGPSASSPASDPADWAIDTALDHNGTAYTFDAVPLGEGEVVPLRPTGADAEYVYGVGFVPSRAAYDDGFGNAYARVVRVQFAFAPDVLVPSQAMLTAGNLKLAGNYKFYGSAGSVHTNGGLEITGTSGVADGDISYSGGCNSGCDQAVGPVATVPVTASDIMTIWNKDEALEVAAEGDWYDHCTGQWYRRASTDTAPCQGTPVTSTNVNIQPWTTLEYNSPIVPGDAVYFFAGDYDITVKSPEGDVTFITGGDLTIGASPSGATPDARYPGLYAFAEGNINVSGNAEAGTFETQTPAVVFSNGTITIAGNMQTSEIAFVAVDGANVGSSYSGGGAGSITYNGGASVDLSPTQVPVVVRWDEVFGP